MSSDNRAGGLSALSACEAVQAMTRGDFSALDYASALIESFELWRDLNAFISGDAEALLAGARDADARRARGDSLGPLHGLPVLLKDNIETSDLPTTAGTPGLKGFRPKRNAAVAQALFDAGALLAGKANMHELAAGTPGTSDFGQVANPHDQRMATGGSSSGCGAAVAARLVPAALGTDTGGSVRIPAALCGIAGLRPTMGRYPSAGIVPISKSRDTAGPMARSVGDLALLDSVLAGAVTGIAPAGLPSIRLNEVRLGLPRQQFYRDLDDQAAAPIEIALEILRGAGARIIEADPPGLQDTATAVRQLLADFEICRDLPAYLAQNGSGVGLGDFVAAVGNPGIKGLIEKRLQGDPMPEADFAREFGKRRSALRQIYRDYFARHDLTALVFPTTLLPARPLDQLQEVEFAGGMAPAFIYTRNTNPGSAAGLPGLTLPAGLTASGLPVGLAFDGAPGSDRVLLALGAAVEAVIPALAAPERRAL